MTKEQAKKHAYYLAALVVDSAAQNMFASFYDDLSEKDRDRLRQALDEVAQHLFNRGKKWNEDENQSARTMGHTG